MVSEYYYLNYSRTAAEVISAFNNLDTGQFFSAFVTNSWNVSLDIPAIWASTVKWEPMMAPSTKLISQRV